MKKAAAFGMTTQYYNRSKLSEELSGGAKYVSFEELLKTSDVLSLNLPLNVCQDCSCYLVGRADKSRNKPATSSRRKNLRS